MTVDTCKLLISGSRVEITVIRLLSINSKEKKKENIYLHM